MLPDTYFKRYGCVYGHRSRYNGNGNWFHEYIRFTNLKKAIEWKNVKEFGWKRELVSKNELKLLGVKFDDKGRIIK